MEPNPYVGPRPYERGDQRNLYGREREAHDLLALITTEREVLVYGPSGAGKTSLINALVIPVLERLGCEVLPVARVGADLPTGIPAETVANIFVYSTLLTLVGGKTSPKALVGQDLTTGLLEHLGQANDGDLVLIFDQFEEIFSTHPEHWQEVVGFFDQVRAALEALPGLRVVFSLREEALAGLDPYLSIFSDCLRARYRLERLDTRGACEAAAGPAAEAGVPFEPGAAEQLVDSLRRIKTLGREPAVLGPDVDPLQLQVVCSQLWNYLPDDARSIRDRDLQLAGDIDNILVEFYELSVREASKAAWITDREVRRWFSQKLITPAGARGQTLQGAKDTAGLSNMAVEVLADRHLLRVEKRAGERWYEIAHERLVEPIQASNRAWERSRMTPLRATAHRWKETGDKSLLYHGKNLAELGELVRAAEQEKSNLHDLEPLEIEFYKASLRAEQAEQRKNTVLVGGLVLAVIIALMMGFLANQATLSAGVASQAESVALENQLKAQQQYATVVAYANLLDARQVTAAGGSDVEAQRGEGLAVSREYASQARVALDHEQPQLSLLLGLQSIGLAKQNGEPRSIVGEQVVRDTLGQVSGIPLQGHTQSITHLAESPVNAQDSTGRWLATASDDGSVRLWDLTAEDPGQTSVALKNPQPAPVTGASFSPDGHALAVSGQDGTIWVWDPAAPDKAPIALAGHTGSVEAVLFSPDGQKLFSAGADKTVRVWAVGQLNQSGAAAPTVLSGHPDAVTRLSLSPDGRWLASAGQDGAVFLWDLTAANPAAAPKKMALDAGVEALAFSPDGRWLAAGGDDRRVVLWNVSAANPAASPLEFGQHNGPVRDLAFSPDGCWLASAGADHKILLWSMAGTPGQNFYALNGHTDEVSTLAFPRIIGPAEDYIAYQLASGSADHTVRLWDLSPVLVKGKGCAHQVDGANQPLPDGRTTELSATVIRGLDGPVNQLLFVANNRWLAGAGADGSARLWNMRLQVTSDEPWLYNTAGMGRIFSTALSGDGRWLVAAGDYGVFAWPFSGGQDAPLALGCETPGAFIIKADDAKERAAAGIMAAGCMDGTVLLWHNRLLDSATADTPAKPFVLEGLKGMVVSLAFSPDGRWLAAGDRDGRLLAWPLSQGTVSGTPLVLMEDAKIVRALAFDPQGRWLASADNVGRVRLWDLSVNPPKLLSTFQPSQDVLAALTVSADGRWLAAGGWDHTLYLWKMDEFTPGQDLPVFTLGGFANWILSVTFSPDGRWLAAGSSDASVRQWDLGKLAALNPASAPAPAPESVSQVLRDHGDQVFAVTYTPDSRWLLSSSADHILRQWDPTQADQAPVQFNGHIRTIRALAVSPDGQYVISASEDGTLRRWTLPLDSLIRAACAQARRELSPEEIHHYLNGGTPVAVCP